MNPTTLDLAPALSDNLPGPDMNTPVLGGRKTQYASAHGCVAWIYEAVYSYASHGAQYTYKVVSSLDKFITDTDTDNGTLDMSATVSMGVHYDWDSGHPATMGQVPKYKIIQHEDWIDVLKYNQDNGRYYIGSYHYLVENHPEYARKFWDKIQTLDNEQRVWVIEFMGTKPRKAERIILKAQIKEWLEGNGTCPERDIKWMLRPFDARSRY